MPQLWRYCDRFSERIATRPSARSSQSADPHRRAAQIRIPLVTPGEVITQELVDYIKLLVKKGMDVIGMEMDHTGLEVVKK